MHITLYGLANCDTVKKARDWLQSQGLDYTFVDFKKTPPSGSLILSWLAQLDESVLLNRKGTTWRGFSEAEQRSVTDAASAARLMAQYPSCIKRPVVEWAVLEGKPGIRVSCGFKAAEWQAML